MNCKTLHVVTNGTHHCLINQANEHQDQLKYMGGNNHCYFDGFIPGFKTVKKLGWLLNTLDLVEKVFFLILETFIAHSSYVT